MLTAEAKKWACIEHEELDSNNWVQMAFRWVTISDTEDRSEFAREYRVYGEIRGAGFSESFQTDDTKRMAYEFYNEKFSVLENGCVYCVECGEFATNPEFANAVSQTGGYCLDCAPEADDTEAIRWF